MGDYHIHLHPHSSDRGLGPDPGVYPPGHIESYVETAAARGVTEVGFTEHLYRCVESADALGRFWDDEPLTDLAAATERFVVEDRTLSLDAYVAAVTAAKDRGLPVLLGLEVDFFPQSIESVLDLISPYPWDILIGSVHWIGGWSFDRAEAAAEYERRGVRRAYEDYFAIETQLAASGAVDVLAHVDVVKKTGYRLAEPPRDLYQPVVTAAATTGTAIEINTSGLRHPCREMFPNPTFLEMFHDAGVPITLASDAHLAERTAAAFDEAVDLARGAGYTERLRFASRQATAVPLPEAASMAP
jgi:histidinol-phosphatase (PHP family)